MKNNKKIIYIFLIFLAIIIVLLVCFISFSKSDNNVKEEEISKNLKEEIIDEKDYSDYNGVYRNKEFKTHFPNVKTNEMEETYATVYLYFDNSTKKMNIRTSLIDQGKVNNGIVTTDYYNYIITLKDDNKIMLKSSDGEAIEYTKISSEEYFEEVYKSKDYLNNIFNGVYKKDGVRIIMYQSSDDKVFFDLNAKSRNYSGEGNIINGNEIVFYDFRDEKTVDLNIKINNNKIVLNFANKREDYYDLNGEYILNRKFTVDEILANEMIYIIAENDDILN